MRYVPHFSCAARNTRGSLRWQLRAPNIDHFFGGGALLVQQVATPSSVQPRRRFTSHMCFWLLTRGNSRRRSESAHRCEFPTNYDND
jgi:hypothetical protein